MLGNMKTDSARTGAKRIGVTRVDIITTRAMMIGDMTSSGVMTGVRTGVMSSPPRELGNEPSENPREGPPMIMGRI